MAYYRIGSLGIVWRGEVLRRDTIHNFPHRPATIDKLVKLGRITPVSGPPLVMLEGFKELGKKLSEKGIVKAEDFLNASLEDLKPVFRNQKKLDEKKQELIDKHLLVVIDNKDCNC